MCVDRRPPVPNQESLTIMTTETQDITDILIEWSRIMYLGRLTGCQLSPQQARDLEQNLAKAISLLESASKDTQWMDRLQRDARRVFIWPDGHARVILDNVESSCSTLREAIAALPPSTTKAEV